MTQGVFNAVLLSVSIAVSVVSLCLGVVTYRRIRRIRLEKSRVFDGSGGML